MVCLASTAKVQVLVRCAREAVLQVKLLKKKKMAKMAGDYSTTRPSRQLIRCYSENFRSSCREFVSTGNRTRVCRVQLLKPRLWA